MKENKTDLFGRRESDFKPLFNACHGAQFQKNLKKICKKKFQNIILGPKMHYLPHVGYNKSFS